LTNSNYTDQKLGEEWGEREMIMRKTRGTTMMEIETTKKLLVRFLLFFWSLDNNFCSFFLEVEYKRKKSHVMSWWQRVKDRD
jgi:hypothetical protein